MLRSDQVPFSGVDADLYHGSLSSFPVDQTGSMMEGQCWYGDTILAASGFSEVQMNAIYNDTENIQINAPADIFNHNPRGTDPMIDHFEVRNFDSSIQRSGLPFYRPQDSCGYGGLQNLVQLNHWTPKEEIISSETYMNMEWQQPELQQNPTCPVQALNMNVVLDTSSHLKVETDAVTSDVAAKSSRSKKIRERSREAECRNRSNISQKVQALQELLPATSKDKRSNQESVLHDVIGHIKYLQLQLKNLIPNLKSYIQELSISKLGGDSSSTPLKFIEGYGHYHSHEQMYDEPFEDILGKLFEENSGAARKLLENKGLHMLPMASVESLLSSQG